MKKKIMIIDDEEDFLKITKLNLERTNNYEVMTLSNGKALISDVRNFKPDLILLDILMPTIGGIEACRQLNNDAHGRNIPIIIISALEKTKDKLKAFKAGVVDYLVKPTELKEIIAAIEKALKFK